MVDISSVDSRDKHMSSLDYSLQLLFLSTQVDVTSWTNPSYQEERTPIGKKKSVSESHSVMLIPRLKKNLLAILRGAKYKLANVCLACVRENSDNCAESEKKSEDKASEQPSNCENGSQEEEIKKGDKDSCNDLQTAINNTSITSKEHPVLHLKAADDGLHCFKQSRRYASNGIREAKALSDTVSSIQKSLQDALGQLCWVECGLNDYRWESVDRDTWTQSHFLSSVGTFTSLLPRTKLWCNHTSTLSLNTAPSMCAWDYTL